MSVTILRRTSTAAILAVAILVPAYAQQAQANLRSITRFQVKPDRVAEFRAAAKEYASLMKDTGSARTYTIWRSISGPNEFALVGYRSKWAEFDGSSDPKTKEKDADLTRARDRIMQCVDRTERILDQLDPELTLQRTAETPKMVRTSRALIRMEQIAEYKALVKNEVIPAMKKAGLKNYGVAQTQYGGPRNEIRTYMGLNSMAELDGPSPLVQAMGGQAQYDKYLARVRPMVIEVQYDLYQFQPDLSYVGSTPQTSAGGQ